MTLASREVADLLERRQEEMTNLLQELAEYESPASDKPAVDRLGKRIAGLCRERGATVNVIEQVEYGDHLRATWPGASAGNVLILSHMDTVWAVGELARRPLRREDGKLYGPGVFDMKAGIVQSIHAIDALRAVNQEHPTVTLLVTSDEETGSRSSREYIEAEARRASAVLVVEPSSDGGALKTARKGVGMYTLRVTGRAAHAGIEPEKGVSALLELAHQVSELHSLNDLESGISVTVGKASGGSRRNVVPASADAEIDLRVLTAIQAESLDRTIMGLKPKLEGARVEVAGGINRPPMERNPQVERLYRLAVKVADEIGITLGESLSGGGSDGNFAAALGVPTLDGLGAVGGGAHALTEHVVINELPRRAALLAGIIVRLGRG
jgi:glutamate carboxypeptidase